MKKVILAIPALLIPLFLAAGGLNPVREYAVTPADYGVDYEEIQIRSTDDMTLAGWFFNAPEETFNLMIISHDGDGNMADMLEMAGSFVSIGYNVICYDYRGYGSSSDFSINNKFLIYAQFAQDLDAVLNYARKYHSKLRTIHLYGKGIGAALSIGVGCDRADDVEKVIADCPYSTFDDIRASIKEVEGRDVLVPIVYNKYILEPFYTLEERHPKIKGILFIGAAEDPIYNTKYIKSLAKRFNSSDVYIAKTGIFDSTYSSDRDAYFQAVKDFSRS